MPCGVSRTGIEPVTWGELIIGDLQFSSRLLQSPALPTELSGVWRLAPPNPDSKSQPKATKLSGVWRLAPPNTIWIMIVSWIEHEAFSVSRRRATTAPHDLKWGHQGIEPWTPETQTLNHTTRPVPHRLLLLHQALYGEEPTLYTFTW